jgi:hypothetical protein
MFLTDQELNKLTGYLRAADQRKWLAQWGWIMGKDYYVDRNGKPVIPRSAIGPHADPRDALTPPAASARGGVLVRHKRKAA